jgi:hypothetical protein
MDNSDVSVLRSLVSADTNRLLTDFDCQRFLRARRMDAEAAAAMAQKWGEWFCTPLSGSTKSPKDLWADFEDKNEGLFTEFCPHSLQGVDKEGYPIYWEKTGTCSSNFWKLKEHISHDELIVRHVRLQLLMSARMVYCSTQFGRNIDRFVVINDFKNLSISPDIDAIKYVIAISDIDSNYFPERLHRSFAINCPWYFTAVFRLVSPFLDPVTLSKIKIIGSDYLPHLLEYIDQSQIPIEYGGELSNSWGWPFPDSSGCSKLELVRYRDTSALFQFSDRDRNDKSTEIEDGEYYSSTDDS